MLRIWKRKKRQRKEGMFVVLFPGGTAQKKIIIPIYGAWSQLELQRFWF
jgi:hypothetical protein